MAVLTERAAGRISEAGVVAAADGAGVWDADGRESLGLAGGIACQNLPPTATDGELEGGLGLLEQSLGDASPGRG